MNSYVHWERAGSALVFWISFFGFSPAVCSNDASPLCADSMAAASLQCTIFTTNTHQRKTNIGLESSAHDIRDQTFFLFSSRGNCVLSSSSPPGAARTYVYFHAGGVRCACSTEKHVHRGRKATGELQPSGTSPTVSNILVSWHCFTARQIKRGSNSSLEWQDNS